MVGTSDGGCGCTRSIPVQFIDLDNMHALHGRFWPIPLETIEGQKEQQFQLQHWGSIRHLPLTQLSNVQ